MDSTKEVSVPSHKELHLKQQEVKLRNGESVTFESFSVSRMRLYHGSQVHGIQEFTAAEETTIGSGVYLTSNKEAAVGYAIVRSSRPESKPTLYEVEIQDLNILNLSTRSAIDAFAKRFREILIERKGQIKVDHEKIMDKSTREFIKYNTVRNIEERIRMIDDNSYKYPKDLLFGVGDWARAMLQEMGYDGLMAIEGGEGGNGVVIRDHDSYVIFDPKKVSVVEQQQFASKIGQKPT